MSSTNEEKLFAKTVPVYFTDSFNKSYRSLFLTIEWKKTSAIAMKKELLITLTDNNDPFFLYNLQLSDDDYQRLRSSQNLIEEHLSSFPQLVIDFLELCLEEANKSHPNYMLHLTVGERIGNMASTAQLDIEQFSRMRPLSLLSLKFLAATDSVVKQHMTGCFKNLQAENENLQQRLSYLEKDFKERFSACESALDRKTQELESVKRDLNEEINKRESKYTNILMEEREKFLNKQREGENRLESERIDRETKLKSEISQLESRVSCLEAINKEIENKRMALEKQVSDLRSHVLSAETELRQKTEALMIAEERNSHTSSDLKEKSGRINHLMENIKKLNEDIRGKERQLNSMQKDLEFSKEKKKKLVKDFEDCKNELKEAKNDASKAKQIIEKLQRVIHDDDMKHKMLHKDASKLEEKLRLKDHDNQSLKKDIERERETNLRLAIEIQHIPMYRAQIAELSKKKTELEMVNEYLTKLMSNKGITLEYVPPPHIAEKLASEEIAQASGDNDFHKKVNSSPPRSAAKSKPALSRLSNPLIENATQPETRQMRKSLLGNTASNQHPGRSMLENFSNSPSQDFNAKGSTILASDRNANKSKLEINSGALSSEFKGLNVSKHSTARKQNKEKGSYIPVKS